MADYISREAVLALADDFEMMLADGTDEIFFEYIPIDKVRSLQAADVRPVVLCRDCRHWDTDWTPTHARENEHFCPNIGLTTREDWFYADGEKREES